MRLQQVNEGPLDFLKGAAGAVGSAAKQAGSQVYQAGAAASAQGNIEKLVAQLASLLTYQDKLTAERKQAAAQAQQQPAQQNQQQGQQQPGQQAPANGPQQSKKLQMSPAAQQMMQNKAKPRVAMGQQGPSLQFNSYMQSMYGDHLDEGVMDFIKGAGAKIGGMMRDKINSKVSQGASVFRDIYSAGSEASSSADEAKAAEQAKTAWNDTQSKIGDATSQIVGILSKFPQNASQLLGAASRKAGGPMAKRIFVMISRAAGQQGVKIDVPTVTQQVPPQQQTPQQQAPQQQPAPQANNNQQQPLSLAPRA